MSEHENELAKASAENGTFDPEKAKKLTADALSQFHTQLKKSERLLMASLLVCVVVMGIAWITLCSSSDTKIMITFGFVLFVAFETTVLMKLWYWVVNTRLTLLRELKRWELQTGTLPSVTAATPLEIEPPGPRHWHGLSRPERIAWLAAIMIGAGALFGYGALKQTEHAETTTLARYITLKPNGASTVVEDFAYLNWDLGPRLSIHHVTDDLKATFRWLDDRGHEMPFRVSTEGGKRYYTVCLNKPMWLPREWLHFTRITESPTGAMRERNRWIHEGEYVNGYPNNRYLVTIELPRGAKVVSTDPKAAQTMNFNRTPQVVLQAARKANERFHYQIQYELADDANYDEPSQ